MIRISKALALVAVLALAACYPPVTTHPVGSTMGLKADPVLSGTWKGAGTDKKPVYLHFLTRTYGPDTLAVIVPARGEASDLIVVSFTTARLGAASYLNVRFAQADGKPVAGQPAGTVPVLYRIDAKGTLTMALMDENAVKAAIAAGRIKGTVGAGTDGDATLTGDAKSTDALFASPAVLRLFHAPFLTLHKVD